MESGIGEFYLIEFQGIGEVLSTFMANVIQWKI